MTRYSTHSLGMLADTHGHLVGIGDKQADLLAGRASLVSGCVAVRFLLPEGRRWRVRTGATCGRAGEARLSAGVVARPADVPHPRPELLRLHTPAAFPL
jgi:hypothetical protein